MGSHSLVFKDWAHAEGILTSGGIGELKDTRIGIDAEAYLQSLVAPKSESYEPLIPALGGLPFSLKQRVDETLDGLREANITAQFFFNGLDLGCKDRASTLRESRKCAAILDEAFKIYDQSRANEAVTIFGKAFMYRNYHIMRSMQAYIHRKGVRTATVPYNAAAQIAYYQQQDYLHAAVGSISCLVFGTEKVIVDFDFANKTFSWVPLNKCLTKLGLSRNLFNDVCLLSGASILPALPNLNLDSGISQLKNVTSMMAEAGNDPYALCTGSSKDMSYRDLFHKARFALKFPVVMTVDAKVEPLGWETGPSDIHDFVGQRLPEEVYFYLQRGVIGPRTLNWRTRAEIVETPPLDGGTNDTYRDLVQTKLLPLRAQALALMTRSLHRYYQKSDVDLVRWWAENNRTALNMPDMTEAAKAADNWHVKINLTSTEAPQASAIPLWYAITALTKDIDAKKTMTPRASGSKPPLREVKDLRANVVWRFLEDRAYINQDHTLSSWGRALKIAFERAISDGYMAREETWTEIQEAIFMAFELLRLDLLNEKPLFAGQQYTGGPAKGTETDKAHALLISRVASLGLFSHDSIGYTGPLSRNLLGYQQATAAVRGALRDLVEMHACNMFLTGSVQRDIGLDDYSDLGSTLPFIEEPNLGLALLVKHFLDEMSTTERAQDCAKWFIHASDIKGDLEKAWALWDAINAGIQAADSSIVSSETRRMFKTADEWLAIKKNKKVSYREDGKPATNGSA